jgi:predicted ATP-grasp superfamily ATP-dependent carboligase
MRAVAVLPPAIGYVGIDLILGRDPGGAEDAVIEVNPRLTTSYVGLRAAAKSNLAQVMWNIAKGEVTSIEFADRPIEFDTSGNVSFAR